MSVNVMCLILELWIFWISPTFKVHNIEVMRKFRVEYCDTNFHKASVFQSCETSPDSGVATVAKSWRKPTMTRSGHVLPCILQKSPPFFRLRKIFRLQQGFPTDPSRKMRIGPVKGMKVRCHCRKQLKVENISRMASYDWWSRGASIFSCAGQSHAVQKFYWMQDQG